MRIIKIYTVDKTMEKHINDWKARGWRGLVEEVIL